MTSLEGKVIVVTGCAGPGGQAVVRRLLADGATVAGADANPTALATLVGSLGAEAARFSGQSVDLLDNSATQQWARGVLAAEGHVDGIAHLVGGWRGGKTFQDNTFADSDLLFSLLVTTLQTVSLAFHDALVASPQARFVIISATAAQAPTAGNASYAAAKAAAEAWTLALADSFAKVQADGELRAAATALVIKALLTDQMKADKPAAKFAGYTHVDVLAAEIAGLWDRSASDLNGVRLPLSH
jgi:NAD(P)-dependent dehydrogenase (short-subunit alcohol dehydrogenase family)